MIFQRFRKCCHGASALEYGLIAAGIALAIIGGAFALGVDLSEFFTSLIDIFNS